MTRRDALITVASITAARSLSAAEAEDLQILALLADIIIPRTDTPGASDVGVHRQIQRIASGKTVLKDGLAKLRDVKFLTLDPATQTDLFVRGPLFQTIKDLTIDAYYATKEGLVTELGWHGNTFVEKFQGCTHPEHQVTSDAG